MSQIFENDLNQIVLVQCKELPSMLGYGSDGTIIYFYEISIGAETISQMTKEEVIAFYKTLKRRQDRINFWFLLKEISWNRNK